MLAALGYTAFALDMYGSGKLANHPDDAKAFMQAVIADADKVQHRFNVALELLKQHDSVDSTKTAAIGYCMGGGIVLAMAKRGTELDAVVSFHGSLGAATQSPVEKDNTQTRMLVLTGADDPFIPAEQVKAFEQEMKDKGIDYQLHSYANAQHSFTNPDADAFGEKFGMPLAYNKSADSDSWQRMQAFLAQAFK